MCSFTLWCWNSPIKLDDGTPSDFGFSITLSAKKYAQLDKEKLAIVFGVKHFHHCLLGHRFTIYSDHKPLQYLFHENNAIPVMTSVCIQCWALTFTAYDYGIVFKSGSQHTNADIRIKQTSATR